MSHAPRGDFRTRPRIRRALAALVVLLGSTVPDPGRAQSRVGDAGGAASRSRAIREEITPRLRLGVRRGLDWLVREQRRSLGFTTEGYPVAENALLGLALLAGGYTDTAGPTSYTAALDEVTTRLLGYQSSTTGYIDDGQRSRMYGHGFATLYLAQLYGTGSRRADSIRGALVSAVRLIERSQTAEGSWDYEPFESRGGFPGGDTSITVCQTMALRAARNLGIVVDSAVVSRAKRFIERAQRDDGGFAYRMQGPAMFTSSAFPRSAAGVCILQSLGDYSSSSLRRGVAYLEKSYRYKGPFPHYGQYYCSQALFQVGGRRWSEYFAWMREYLLDYQQSDGSWGESQSEPSAAVRTALALIVLQLPYRFLPIHER